jgi:putative phosphoesterase
MMRIAIISDIHGNRTAFEAVLADLRETAPDLVLHGGDLSLSGASPLEIVDHIRDLGWPGVVGNVDEVLFRPVSLQEFAQQSSAPPELFTAIEEMAADTRALLGEERLAWLRDLPRVQRNGSLVLVHAVPEDLWRAPASDASDADLESAFGPLGDSVVVYAHIHRPYIRSVGQRTIVNTGSVSLSYDGDPRASYLLLDEDKPSIRRVAYDLDKELKALAKCGLPHADWIARSLRSARPEMP